MTIIRYGLSNIASNPPVTSPAKRRLIVSLELNSKNNNKIKKEKKEREVK
jgi:hypothetical protein